MRFSSVLLFGVTVLALTPTATQAEKPCKNRINLLFLVDKSASIQPAHWVLEKQFLREMIDTFWITPTHTRVSIVLFGNHVRHKFDFNEFTTRDQLKKAVDELTCPKCGSGRTATGSALKFGREQSLTSDNGARAGAKNVVVVITDGRSTEDADFVKENADLLKKVASVIAVGVGNIKKEELAVIASSESLVFLSRNFDALSSITGNIAEQTCEAVIIAPTAICTGSINLLFLVDKSASIRPKHWVLAKEFLKQLLETFWIGESNTRVSIVLFGNHVRHKISFTQYHTKEQLQKAIAELTCPDCGSGQTVTGAALDYGRELSLTSDNGARTGSKNVVVVITDGRSTEKADFVKEKADLMKKVATVVAVGVGRIEKSELAVIASRDSLVFTSTNFDELSKITQNIADQTCEAAVAAPTASCTGHINLLLLVDKSESINDKDWIQAREFLKEIIDAFWISPKNTRVSMVLFGNNVIHKFNFNKFTAKDTLHKAIAEMQCPECGNGQTVTGSALQFGRETSFTSANGARVGGKNVVVVLTDGRATESADFVRESATQMKTVATVVAVGIGRINRDELAVIASRDELVFVSNNFDVLGKITENLADKTCAASVHAQVASCTAQINLVFVIDKSGSINAGLVASTKKFMKEMISKFVIGPSNTRVSIVLYGLNVRPKMFLNQFKTKELILKAIDDMTCPHCGLGRTVTGAALRFVAEKSFTSQYGARVGSKNVVVLITEGKGSDSLDVVKQSVDLMKKVATIVTLGIGNIKENELALFGSPANLLFTSKKIDELPELVAHRTCEASISASVARCTEHINLLFVVDKSGSIRAGMWNLEKQFLKDMIDRFWISPTYTRVSIVLFGLNVRHQFNFDKYNSKETLQKAIDDLKCLDCGYGKTMVGSALKFAFDKSFSSEYGTRTGSKNMLVLVTEGEGSEGQAFLKKNADLVKSGATIVVVGVGNMKKNQLAPIASSADLLFASADLGKITKSVADKTCEASNTAPVALCTGHINLLFLVDKSGSIGAEDWKLEKQFLKEMIDQFYISPAHTRVSIAIFGKFVRHKFNFNQFMTLEALQKAVADLSCPDCGLGRTVTGAALQFGREKSLTSDYGARVGSKNVVVVLTEGGFSEGRPFVQKHADLMKSVAAVAAVGIGSLVKRADLSLIASSDNLVFIAKDFEELEKTSINVAAKTCEASVTAPVAICTAHINLLFVLDKSGSINARLFNLQKTFLKQMIDQFFISPALARVSILLFGLNVRHKFNFNQYSTKDLLKKAIDDMQCPDCGLGRTVTGQALQFAHESSFTSAYGARAGSRNVVVLITEGIGSDGQAMTKKNADLLKAKAKILIVGVGNMIRNQLALMVSSDKGLFTSGDFGAKIVKTIADRTCEAAMTAPVASCTTHINLLFLVDKSGSVNAADFSLEKRFLKEMIDEFWISPTHSRFSVVLFGNHVRHKFSFTQYNSKALLHKAVDDLSCPDCGLGQTKVGTALEFGREISFSTDNGARVGSHNVVIVITEGGFSESADFVMEKANLMKSVATVVAVGVGVKKSEELALLASSDNLVIASKDWEELGRITKNIGAKTCDASITAPIASCTAHINLQFVVDKSGSIRPEMWKAEKQFLIEMIDRFWISRAHTRVSIVLFGLKVVQRFDFNKYSSKETLRQAIEVLTCADCGLGRTVTGQALKHVFETSYTSEYGARTGSKNVVVLITEGQGSDGAAMVKKNADLLKTKAKIVVVGIGYMNRNQLALMASSDSLLFTPKELGGLTTKHIADKTCEASMTAPVATCTASINLLFLVDKSDSIRPEHWVMEKKFLKEIIDVFWINPSNVRVSIVLFGNDVRHKFDFNKYTTRESLQQAIVDLTCPDCGKGLTATGASLKFGVEHSLTSENGARAESRNVVVVLTDGRSTEEAAFLKENADLMKTKATVVAVGVGRIVREELVLIASSEKLVFTANNFDELAFITGGIADKTCESGVVTSP